VQIDGEWVLSDDFLDSIFQKMEEQGLVKTTFWEGNITDESHFIGLVKNRNNHVVFFFQGRQCVGLAWLSAVTSNYAFGHFCLFREIWGDTEKVGRDCVDYWFSWPGSNGPLLDVIVGIMPGFNRRAHKFVERIGWERLGSIPGMFRDSELSRDDAVIYYVTRD